MQVSVEKTSELSRKMTITVPEEIVQDKVNERLKSVAREVKVDGFRPGKVPQKIIKKMYGARVRDEVSGDLIQTHYFDALQENELRPAGMPQIDPVASDEGLVFMATFEVYPEFSLDNLGDIAIKKPVASVESSDVDTMIEKLREQKKTWQASEQEAQEGNQVTIKLSGESEGENFTDGTIENFEVEIGSNRMIPGFEEQLKGLVVGATKKFEVTFPEDYGNEKIAGKPAEFDIEVLDVEVSVIPEIDAEFIQAYGVESGDLDEFRADVEKNMQRELGEGLKARLKNTVLDALVENVSVTLPVSMINQEIESLMKPYYESAKKQNRDVNELQLPKENFEEQAKRRVALGLILAEIIQKNEIKAEEGAVRAVIDGMAQSYEQPEEVINWYYGDKKNLVEVEQMVLEDATVDWVLNQVNVTDEAVLFSDIMDASAQQ
ncbi:MAG: trigger factor [Methyloprofundus sp.]|nr:trigger factor [Methyloprofundus sp.]